MTGGLSPGKEANDEGGEAIRRVHDGAARKHAGCRPVAKGPSDKEIAKRLGVTHRTVRTHFEKLFHDRGIRNRSQAIALWSARSMESRHQRPADECPYPKPFPPNFTA